MEGSPLRWETWRHAQDLGNALLDFWKKRFLVNSLRFSKDSRVFTSVPEVGILHERDARFQSKCSFRVGEMPLFESCLLLKNGRSKKKAISRRRNATFFLSAVFQGGLTRKLDRGSPDLSLAAFSKQGVSPWRNAYFWKNRLFHVGETPTFHFGSMSPPGSLLLCLVSIAFSAIAHLLFFWRPALRGFSKVGVSRRRNDIFQK